MVHRPLFQPNQPVDIASWREYFKQHETDVMIYDAIFSLRDRVEPLACYRHMKEKARIELRRIPEDIVEQLFTRFEPFIDQLPAGHGRGHFTRDLIHLMTIFQDPEINTYDAVELFVGLIGGDFHDIGNSVVERYDDSKHFSSHSEVGAYLFGEVAKDIIPKHLLQLIQFCIAAHTHYLKDIEIVKEINGRQERRVRSPFDDVVDEKGNKFAMWLTQQSDRLDAQGVVYAIRVILTKAEQVTDYLDGKFYVTSEDAMKNFRHQFSPVFRSLSYKQQLPTAFEQTATVLEHIHRFCESPLTDTPYSRYDSAFYIDSLMTPPALEVFQFILKVIAKPALVIKDRRQKAFEKFFALCRVVDPASDTEHVISVLREKLGQLSDEEQSQWSAGFEVLVDELYPRYYKRMEKLLAVVPQVKEKKLDTILKHAHQLAREKLKQFAPDGS